MAMNINSGDTKLVLLCPAWKKFRSVKTVKAGTVILHSEADDVIPFANSEELICNSGLPASSLIEVGNDHRLADPESLALMLAAVICWGQEKCCSGRMMNHNHLRDQLTIVVGISHFGFLNSHPASC